MELDYLKRNWEDLREKTAAYIKEMPSDDLEFRGKLMSKILLMHIAGSTK